MVTKLISKHQYFFGRNIDLFYMSYTKIKKREGYVVRVLPYNVTFLCGSMYIIYHSLFACSLIPQLGCFCNFMVSLVLLSGVIASSFPSVW